MIYNECCLQTLARMKDDSVDLVITSPPYNMNLRIMNGEYKSRQIISELTTKYSSFPDNLPIDDFYEFHSSVLRELLRVSHLVFYNISIVTGSKRAFFKIIGEFNEQLKDIIVWGKPNVQPSIRDGVINRGTELILIFDSNNAISRRFEPSYFQRGTMSDLWKTGYHKSTDKDHNATFPIGLVYKILSGFSKEGDVVYDPFSGTGTTAIGCIHMGRKYIGSEIIRETYLRSLNKIKQHEDQLYIFGGKL